MKGLIEEIEEFQVKIEKDLGMGAELLTDEAILDNLESWAYFRAIGEKEFPGNLKSFVDSMERVDAEHLDEERDRLTEKLRHIYFNGEMDG